MWIHKRTFEEIIARTEVVGHENTGTSRFGSPSVQRIAIIAFTGSICGSCRAHPSVCTISLWSTSGTPKTCCLGASDLLQAPEASCNCDITVSAGVVVARLVRHFLEFLEGAINCKSWKPTTISIRDIGQEFVAITTTLVLHGLHSRRIEDHCIANASHNHEASPTTGYAIGRVTSRSSRSLAQSASAYSEWVGIGTALRNLNRSLSHGFRKRGAYDPTFRSAR